MLHAISRRSLLAGAGLAPAAWAKPSMTVAPFESSVTPPRGSALCFGLVPPATGKDDPLLARGVVIRPGGQKPIVLCAVDWLGIGNGGLDEARASIARSLETEPGRVALHTVHQHDAPGYDSTAEELLKAARLDDVLQPGDFCRGALSAIAVAASVAEPVRVTHMSTGWAAVEGVASNRRLLDADGKFLFQRFTACKNSPHCDAPEGTIDPQLRTVSFFDGDKRIASLHYYATHPMSHYGKGVISADFVGAARRAMEGFHVYFTGAAGNIGAGKYNDGSPGRRALLAGRIEAAMRKSIAGEARRAVGKVDWKRVEVALPHREGEEFTEQAIERTIADASKLPRDRASAGRYLAWLRLRRSGRKIDVSALNFDGGSVLHLPGELFVEYQLAAQKERPGLVVAMAAYGDYGPMYIGTRAAYGEGGYETSIVSRVGPDAETILLDAIRKLGRA